MKLLFGLNDELTKLAERKLRGVWPTADLKPCQSIGVATGEKGDDKLLAIVTYFDFHPEYGTCQVAICSWSPMWSQRDIIKALLSIPFEDYGVKKLCAQIPKDNQRALKFNLGIGFKQEAVLRNQLGAGKHLCLTYLMEPEYKKLYCDKKTISLSELKVVQD